MENVEALAGAKRRFVPASPLDFSRYAKDLAWLLNVKLHQAQELLSRIYGYEHLHELQQAMKRGLAAGPYWDDGPTDGELCDEHRLLEGLPGERSMRPVNVLLAWKKEKASSEWLEENERFIVELGLMDSPASHRDCVKRVKGYLQGEWSVDSHGYPTGFWSFIAGYNIHRDTNEESEVAQALKESGSASWIWRSGDPMGRMSQKACVAMSRGVDVVLELGKLIEHEEVNWAFGFDQDDQEWGSMWAAIARSHEWGDSWQVACAGHVFGLDVAEIDDEKMNDVSTFVAWPTEQALKRCESEMSFREASQRVGKWRLGWLMAAAEEWSDGPHRIVSLTGQTSHRGEQGAWITDNDYVSLVMRRTPQFDYEQSIKLMEVAGTLVLEGDDGTTRVGGLVQGWHFSPLGEYYANFDAIADFLDDKPVLQLGWRVVRQYMAMRGIETMKQWVNSEEGCGMSLLSLRLPSGADRDECCARFIKLIAECFDEEGGPYTESDDKYLGDEIAGLEEALMQTDELTLVTPGLIVVSVDGVEGLGVSIADDDGGGRQILVRNTSRPLDSRAGIRMYSRMGMRDSENEKRLRARRLLEKVGETSVDVAVLDLSAMKGSEREEDGL